MTLEQINLLSLLDAPTLTIINNRLTAKGVTPSTLPQREEELVLYKSELTVIEVERLRLEYEAQKAAAEATRLAEIARVAALTARYNALVDVHGLAVLAGLNYVNIALVLREAIEGNSTNLALLESKVSELTTANNNANLIRQKVELGKKTRQVCDSVLDLISGYNIDRNLTSAQITTMQSTFAPIELALKSSRPTQAKALITTIVVDGVLVTAEMKTNCLSLLVNY